MRALTAPGPPPRTRLPMLANSLALIGAKVVAMSLGFLFWVLAARTFPQAEVGIAAGVVATMMLCTQVALLGVGSGVITLLREHERDPAPLLNTSFTLVAITSAACASIVVLLASGAFGELDVIGSSLPYALLFALATLLGTWGIVFDQASTALRRGDHVLVRGAAFGAVAVLAVLALGPHGAGASGSAALLAPWAIAGLAGCALGGRQLRRSVRGFRALAGVDRGLVRRLLTIGAANWALTLAERAPGLVLPVVVAELLSPEANATWYAAWMMAWVVYIVPIQVGMTVFAEVASDPAGLARAVRHGMGHSLTVGALGALAVLLTAPLLLRILGSDYAAQGAEPLRILVLGFVPLTFLHVYFAACRGTGRLTEATVAGWILALGSVAAGALAGTSEGLRGIALAWVVAQCLGAIWAGIRLPRIGARRRGAAARLVPEP